MARTKRSATPPTVCDSVTNDPLVLVQFSYWAKFVVPASVASDIIRHLSDPRVVRVEEYDSMWLPVKSDWIIKAVDEPFIADLPTDNEEMRKAYLAWVKTKRELGDKATPQPYSVFKQLHDEGGT